MSHPTSCSFSPCDREPYATGLCNAHYWQKRKGIPLGAVSPVYRRGRSMQERLDALTDKSGDCWIWTGAKTPAGYGVINRGARGKTMPAHRAAYIEAHGPIPDGWHIDHKCHVPACVNPDHLHAVTPKENHENRSAASIRAKSGVRGVSWHQNRWVVQVMHNRHNYYGGRFKELSDAEAAAIELRNRLFSNNLLDRE